MSDSATKKPKARLTAKGNVKLTLTKREARLIVALIGPTYGSMGYGIYSPLNDLVGDPKIFGGGRTLWSIHSDEVTE